MGGHIARDPQREGKHRANNNGNGKRLGVLQLGSFLCQDNHGNNSRQSSQHQNPVQHSLDARQVKIQNMQSCVKTMCAQSCEVWEGLEAALEDRPPGRRLVALPRNEYDCFRRTPRLRDEHEWDRLRTPGLGPHSAHNPRGDE